MRGALGFHGLPIWPILALEFRDLRLNHTGFWVLRFVTGCGFGHFLCLGLGILLKIPILLGFRSHTVQVVN